MIGRPELAHDQEYATPEARLKHLDEVFGIVQEWTLNFTKFEVLGQLNKIDVPCGPILSTEDLINEKSLIDRGMIATVTHPDRGEFKTVGCPIVLSDTPVEITTSPRLGEHSEEILREIGYDVDLSELQAEGVI